MLEKTIKARVKKRLKELGCYNFWPVQMGLGIATLDCLVCYEGKFYAIETKRPGGNLTTRQKFSILQIEKAGGTVFVIDSLEKADELLR